MGEWTRFRATGATRASVAPPVRVLPRRRSEALAFLTAAVAEVAVAVVAIVVLNGGPGKPHRTSPPAAHDGGTSWHPGDVGGQVNDLATSAGEVYAIVSHGTASGRLMHSPADQDHWTPVAAAGQVSGGLWVLGPAVIVQSSSRCRPRHRRARLG
jgi:hypothetical protein